MNPTFGTMKATLVLKNNLTGIEMIPISASGDLGKLKLKKIGVYNIYNDFLEKILFRED